MVNSDELLDLGKLERARSTVISFFEKSKEFRQEHEEIWDRVYSEYMNQRSHKQSKLSKANLKSAKAFATIETFVPVHHKAFLEKDNVLVIGKKPETRGIAASITDQFSTQLDEIEGYRVALAEFFKSKYIYGTAIAKVPWRYEEKIINDRVVQNDPDGVPKVVRGKRFITVHDGPDFQFINLEDFFPDPGATQPGQIQSMRGCVHRSYRTLDQLLKSEKRRNANGETTGIYSNLGELRKSIRNGGTDAWSNRKYSPLDAFQASKNAYNRVPNNLQNTDKIELWEYWGQFEVSPGRYEEYVITLANGNVVIRCDVNPYTFQHKPFLADVDYIVPGQFYGVGEIEHVLSNIKESSALRNARLDSINQAVNRMWKVDRNAGINVRNLYSRPNGIVLTSDMNGLQEIPGPILPGDVDGAIAAMDFEYQNITAQIDASQSTAALGRAFTRTATGVNFLQNTTNNRLLHKIEISDELFTKNLGRIFLALNYQFMDDASWSKYNTSIPNPFSQIDAEAILRGFDFTAAAARDYISRSERLEFLNQVFPQIAQIGETTEPGRIRWSGFWSRLFKDIQWPDPNELIRSDEEMAQMAEQRRQQQIQDMMTQQQMQTEGQIQAKEAEHNLGVDRDAAKSANEAGLKLVENLFNNGKPNPNQQI